MNIQSVVTIVIFLLIMAITIVGSVISSKRKKNLKKTKNITEHTTISELLEYDIGIAEVLKSHGMHCVGCPSSAGEELWQACEVHGLNIDDVLSSIIEYINNKS